MWIITRIQEISGNPRTTRLYDCSKRAITRDIMERIRLARREAAVLRSMTSIEEVQTHIFHADILSRKLYDQRRMNPEKSRIVM